MANVSETSPFKKQKLDDLGSNVGRPNSHETSTDLRSNATTANFHKTSATQQASAPTTSSSSPSRSFSSCFNYWKASDDEKQSISHSVRSFGVRVFRYYASLSYVIYILVYCFCLIFFFLFFWFSFRL